MKRFALASCLLILLNSVHSFAQSCSGTNIESLIITKADLSCAGSNDGSISISNIGTQFTSDQIIIEVKNLGGEVIYSSSTVGIGASFVNITKLQPGIYDVKVDQYAREFVNGQFVLTTLKCRKTASPQILSPDCDVRFEQLLFNTDPCDPAFGMASAKIKGTFCAGWPRTYRIINGARDMTQNVFTIGLYKPDSTYSGSQLNGLKPGDTVRFQLLNGSYLAFPGENIDSSKCHIFSPTYIMPCDLTIDSVSVVPNSATLHTVTGKVSSAYLCRYGPAYNFLIDVRDSNNVLQTNGTIQQDGRFSFNIAASLSKLKLVWKLGDRCQVEEMVEMPNSWVGGVSTAWEDAANWSQNAVPDATRDVFINNPSGAPKTIIINSDVQVNSLKLSSGVNLVVGPGKKLNVLH